MAIPCHTHMRRSTLFTINTTPSKTEEKQFPLLEACCHTTYPEEEIPETENPNFRLSLKQSPTKTRIDQFYSGFATVHCHFIFDRAQQILRT
jgi:hypothetical protein